MTVSDLIARLGGAARVAQGCGVTRWQPYRWAANGQTPSQHDFPLLAMARERGVTLTLEDLARNRAESRGGRMAAE